jgi:hypothetical protein
MSLRPLRAALMGLCLASLAACGSNSSVVGGTPDAGAPQDVGAMDVNPLDVASADTGPADAGADAPADTGVDAGVDTGPVVRCSPYERVCGGACVDVGSDRRHCGGCGAACAAGQGCVAGICQEGCGAGQSLCGDRCTDTRFDPDHCGACGTRCPNDQVCNRGQCVTTCDGAGSGVTECRPVEGVRYCADTQIDRRNCGACSTLCPVGQVCFNGACATACPPGQIRCGAECVNPRNDRDHCGACGNRCPTGQVCSGSVCTLECAAPQVACGNGDARRCVDTRTDAAHCGACDAACTQGERCVEGVCLLSCPPGQSVCARACRDLASDNAHCGACGNACPAGRACAGGRCTVTCGAGQSPCDDVCRDLSTDLAHCGACGTVCPRPTNGEARCEMGRCARSCLTGYADCDADAANGCEADLRASTQHCGACGRACTTPQGTPACNNGVCAVAACDTGRGDCDGNASNGCEVDVTGTVAHCGGCGRACNLANATASCAMGRCAVMACAEGFRDCDGDPANGCEVNTRADNGNCGACGTVCAAGQVCAMGACTLSCPSGQTACQSGCFDVQTAPGHCGACDRACPARANAAVGCAAGVCTAACNNGYGDCDSDPATGCETDLRSAVAHCGACGRSCAVAGGTAACVNGQCAVAACNAGRGDCDGDPSNGCEADLTTSDTHCGACGSRCALPGATSRCAAGVCTQVACLPTACDLDGNTTTGCEAMRRSDSFDGTSLGSYWVQTVGAAPTFTVGGGALTITDAPFASTPSLPSHSWIYDTEIDRGNQRVWAHTIGTGPFEMAFDYRWESNVVELTLAGIALVNASNQVEVFAGAWDGYTAALGTTTALVRVPGSAGDVGWSTGFMGTGQGTFTVRRVGTTLTVSHDGRTVVTANNNTADIRGVALVALAHRAGSATYPFGTFVLSDLRLCY